MALPHPAAGRVAVALALLAAAAPAGCFRAYNPTSFPHWGYGGSIDRTHAKPAGGAYFRNFDPSACRVTLTPRHGSAPCGKEMVFVASVLDEDDFPRRSRRVEWLLDGPGHIVEVDESGWFAGRGYKVDNKYAVSHTDYREHRITRGNDDPRDDIVICPGQTWCVVASAIEGLTTVTAYAPEVHNWERGRATATVSWGGAGGPSPVPVLPGDGFPAPAPGGGVVFPPPVISRSPGEVDLTTTVSRSRAGATPSVRVRYKIVEGNAAQLVSRSGGDGARAGTAHYGDNPRLTEVDPDATGHAAVTVRSSGRAGESTRVQIEVVKLGADGFETGEVIDRSETVVEWSAPDLILTARAPKTAAPGGEAPVTVTLRNAGRSESRAVTLRLTVPDGAELLRTEPEGRPQGRSVSWQFPPLAGGRTAEATAVLKPTKGGALDLVATAETGDGLRAEQRATIAVEAASFTLAVTPPPSAGVGLSTRIGVAVTNTGAGTLNGVTAWLALPAGVEADGATTPLELPIGAIPAGATKRAEATVRATQAGTFRVPVTTTADGGLSRKEEATFEARRTEAKLSLVGPDKVKLGQTGLWELRLTNAGDAPLTSGTLRVNLPRGLSAASASDDGRVVTADVAEWPAGTLKPGATKVVRVGARAEEMATGATLRASFAAPELPERVSATAPLDVEGEPALAVEIIDPPGTLAVGRRAAVRLRVRNTGRGPARRAELVLTTSPEVGVLGGTGPDRRRIGPAGADRMAFDPLDELRPGESAAFVVELSAAKPGLARLQAELRADHLPQPLRDEQTLQVVP